MVKQTMTHVLVIHVLSSLESVEDALAAVKAGVDVKEINLGSSAYKEGKVNVNKALSFDQTDVDAIKELQSLGVKFDV